MLRKNNKLFLFLLLSSFSFLIGNILNIFFIEITKIDKRFSFLITYLILFFTNFTFCKYKIFTFESKNNLSIKNFFMITGFFRLLEYLLSLILLHNSNLHYLILLNITTITFVIIKFFILNKITKYS